MLFFEGIPIFSNTYMGFIKSEKIKRSEQVFVSRGNRLSFAGLLALLLLFSGCGSGANDEFDGKGGRLPDVKLSGLTGEAATSTAALRGRPLIINFWATWCAPCRQEMPGLDRLSRRLAAHGVQVIGVTLDEDLHLAREFVRTMALTFPVYVEGREQETMRRRLRVNALPESVLVAADGTIKARIAGARDWDGDEGMHLVRQAFGIRLDEVPAR